MNWLVRWVDWLNGDRSLAECALIGAACYLVPWGLVRAALIVVDRAGARDAKNP